MDLARVVQPVSRGWTAARMVVLGAAISMLWPQPALTREAWMVEEALRRGWHADPVVVRHLQEVERRLGVERDVLDRAGMLRADPVVRARLVQRLRRSVQAGLQPSRAELQAHLEAHATRFGRPGQVLVAVAYGDRPTADHAASWTTPARVATLHGSAVASALRTTTRWEGPVQTVRGNAWVRVDDERAGELPALDDVWAEVRDDWARQPGRVEAAVDRMR